MRPKTLTSPEQLSAAISRIEKLSSAPHVLRRAIALLRDPNSDIPAIVEVIRTDSVLTADIIRGANSAFYAAGERVASLDRAVEKIGFRESVRLLNLAAAHVLAGRDLAVYRISRETFWAESLFHGIFMEELARATGQADPDTAHTAGLLRFVGRLAINDCLSALGVGLGWDRALPIEDWEEEAVGMPQSKAAAVLLRAWRFPDELCDAIEFQHQPTAGFAPNWLAEALHFTSLLVSEGYSPVMATITRSELPDCPFAARGCITAEQANALLEVARSRFAEVKQQLYA